MNRKSVVICAVALACVWPLGPLFAPPVNSLISRFWRNFVKEEGPKMVEGIEKRQAARPSREAARSTEESIAAYRRVEETLKSEDFADLFWITADKETQARARAEAGELERQLDQEATRIEEEEELAEKCKADMRSVLKQTACYCLKTKIESDHWPNEEDLYKFVLQRLEKTGVECGLNRLAHRMVGTVPSGLVARATNKLAEVLASQMMPGPASHPQPSNMRTKAELLVLHSFCKGK